jgi:hypothetical protein
VGASPERKTASGLAVFGESEIAFTSTQMRQFIPAAEGCGVNRKKR